MDYQMDAVPVIAVSSENLSQRWPSIVLAIETATYIAVDVELSGLGNRKSLTSKSVEERYAEISRSAKTRSILSLGLSCFSARHVTPACPSPRDSGIDCDDVVYNVDNFDIILLSNSDYIVEPNSLRFLSEHGFDFNEQYSKGISYQPAGSGFDLSDDDDDGEKASIVRLVRRLIFTANRPLVLHNGLIDLAFIYQHFYAELPSKLSTFVADLNELFPAGIYDTKYIAEYNLGHPASHLQYVFRKLQLLNIPRSGIRDPSRRKIFGINFQKFDAHNDCIDYRDFSISKETDFKKEIICLQYMNHGWCSNGVKCRLSHDVSAFIQMEHFKSNYKRKRKHTEPIDDVRSLTKSDDVVGHRAGYDAFMTGFAMAAIFIILEEPSKLNGAINRICLGGKDQPLLIQKSPYASTSKNHRAFMEKCKTI